MVCGRLNSSVASLSQSRYGSFVLSVGYQGENSVTRASELRRASNILGVKLSGMYGGDPPVLNEKESQPVKNRFWQSTARTYSKCWG